MSLLPVFQAYTHALRLRQSVTFPRCLGLIVEQYTIKQAEYGRNHYKVVWPMLQPR
jgi:hypothetical protein